MKKSALFSGTGIGAGAAMRDDDPLIVLKDRTIGACRGRAARGSPG